jgi:hypothetical protein
LELLGGFQPQWHVAEFWGEPMEALQEADVLAADHLREVAHGPGGRLDVLAQPSL